MGEWSCNYCGFSTNGGPIVCCYEREVDVLRVELAETKAELEKEESEHNRIEREQHEEIMSLKAALEQMTNSRDALANSDKTGLRQRVLSLEAALAAAQKRVKELERIAPKDPYEIDEGVFVPKAYRDAHEAVWQDMKRERDEANARAQSAEEYARKAEQFATAKADEHYRGIAQSARAEALEDAAQVCDTWAGYYPPEMFLEPVIIYGEPITQTFVTRLSASFGRHVSNTIANEIRALLTPNKAPEEGT